MKNNNLKIKNDIKKRAYIYAIDIIKMIDKMPSKDQSAKIISKQLLRSATSVGANIIEAQAGSSKKDFTNFMSHALKSANESKFWLALLKDTNKVKHEQYEPLKNETVELSNILAASILTLKGKR